MFSFLLASFFSFLYLRAVSSQTVSLQYEPVYSSQRTCALLGCQGINTDDTDILAEHLNCDTDGNSPIENSCFCRSDLQTEAEYFLSTCVQNFCSNTQDATSAVSIYDAYCTSAGYLKSTGNPAATTTANTPGSSSTSTNTNTGSTTENSSSSSGKMFGPLTEADFIGVIVGVAGVILTAIGVYYAYLTYHK